MRRLTICEKMDYPEKSIEIRRDRMVALEHKGERIRSDDSAIICAVREGGEFRGGAIWLSRMYDWEFGIDSEGVVCVVPLRK